MAHDGTSQRRFAGTIGTHEGVDFSGLKSEGNIPEDFLLSDGDREVLEGEHRVSECDVQG